MAQPRPLPGWITRAAPLAAAAILAACSSAPPRQVETRSTPAPVENRDNIIRSQGGGYLPGDGPGAEIPRNLDDIPDATPQNEPLHRYANRPYVALGKTYIPRTTTGNFKETGIASWYGKKFHGQPTSSGEPYDMYAMTAAHPTLPIPSYVRVTNTASGKSVIVRINDRGPFLHDRVIDLSYTAAHKLGIIASGSAEVEVEGLPATPVANNKETSPGIPPAVASAPTIVRSSTLTPPDSNVYLQLGAFSTQSAAQDFLAKMRAELGDAGKQLMLFLKDGLVRVHLGPYASQNDARNNAETLKNRLGFKPILNLH